MIDSNNGQVELSSQATFFFTVFSCAECKSTLIERGVKGVSTMPEFVDASL